MTKKHCVPARINQHLPHLLFSQNCRGLKVDSRIDEITDQPNQSNPHTLGVCMNCVEALGSLYFITYMRTFPESTQIF